MSSHVGETVLLLVFYPSNDGPYAGQSATVLRACSHLAEEVSTDVVPFGIAAESVYSQRRFADEAGLSLTLLGDTGHELIEEYGVAETRSCGQTVATLSVFAIDFTGLLVYTWTASGPQETPPTTELETTLESASPTGSARGAYRLGYTLYQEGRRHLSRGLSHCEDAEWVLAKGEFADACENLSHATDRFILSQGLATDEMTDVADRGRQRATTLWQAAEWLAGYATAGKHGNEERKHRTRREAETLLTEVSDIESLPEPDSILARSEPTRSPDR